MASPKGPEKRNEVALGVKKTPAGWVLTEYIIQGDKVVSSESTTPDIRAVTLGKLRVAIRQFWKSLG